MDTETEQPSRQTIFGWLRLNLGVTLAVLSIVSGAVGALITGTMRVDANTYQMSDLVRVNNEQQQRLDQFHQDMVDVDRRLNDSASKVNDLRRARDAEMASLAQRVAVLEAQLRFLADRTPVPQIGARK